MVMVIMMLDVAVTIVPAVAVALARPSGCLCPQMTVATLVEATITRKMQGSRPNLLAAAALQAILMKMAVMTVVGTPVVVDAALARTAHGQLGAPLEQDEVGFVRSSPHDDSGPSSVGA